MALAHLRGIQIKLFGNLVEMNFERVARLWCSMPAFWSTGWLVCKSAQSLKLITRHFVGHRLQRAGVESAGDAVAAIRAAVKKRLEVHRGDRPIFLHAGLHMHEHWMAAAMAVENFFTR